MKEFRNVKKNNPRILAKDLYSYIAANTSLTREQVQECFQSYSNMIMELVESKYSTNDLTITLPHLGNFYFQYFKGRKNGSTYFQWGKTHVANNEPSFYRIKFKAYNKVNAALKEKTKTYEE